MCNSLAHNNYTLYFEIKILEPWAYTLYINFAPISYFLILPIIIWHFIYNGPYLRIINLKWYKLYKVYKNYLTHFKYKLYTIFNYHRPKLYKGIFKARKLHILHI